MDQSQTNPGVARLAHRGVAPSASVVRGLASTEVSGPRNGTVGLTLVADRLVFARPSEGVPSEWSEAIEKLTRGLGVDADWLDSEPTSGIFEKARRAVGVSADKRAPVFAPWRVISPTSFQLGQTSLAVPEAQWVASYLFDFGPVCAGSHGALDLVLMSPCPQTCVTDDPLVGPLPKLSTLASMIRSASREGRKNLAIVVSEASRASLATRLLGFDAALNDASLDVEFISIEETVVEIQRGALDWDAMIVMPDTRGVVFAMLAQATGVTGPWPMLWFERGLRLVTCEALDGATNNNALDATALMQSLALVARNSSRHFQAERFFKSWAAVRDTGVVTPARSSSAPYVNEIDEAAFIDRAASNGVQTSRPLPNWKGIACDNRPSGTTVQSVRLSLVT